MKNSIQKMVTLQVEHFFKTYSVRKESDLFDIATELSRTGELWKNKELHLSFCPYSKLGVGRDDDEISVELDGGIHMSNETTKLTGT